MDIEELKPKFLNYQSGIIGLDRFTHMLVLYQCPDQEHRSREDDMNNYYDQIFKTLRDHQNRYSYFLLAAVGAGIALSIRQTQNSLLSWSLLPLGVAVLLWGISFYCGCRYLAYIAVSLHVNVDLLRAQQGTHSEIGRDPMAVQAGCQILREIFEEKSKRANRNSLWQFRFLVAGSLAYITWHILEMYSRAANR